MMSKLDLLAIRNELEDAKAVLGESITLDNVIALKRIAAIEHVAKAIEGQGQDFFGKLSEMQANMPEPGMFY